MGKLPKKPKISSAKRTAWTYFSKYIRLRDSIVTTGTTTECECITCGNRYPITVINAGHFIPGRNNAVLFDERQVHGQCPRCNMSGGMWSEYLDFMISEYGEEAVKVMRATHNNIKLYTVEDLKAISKQYREKYEALLKEFGG
jgi:hypothetical protein